MTTNTPISAQAAAAAVAASSSVAATASSARSYLTTEGLYTGGGWYMYGTEEGGGGDGNAEDAKRTGWYAQLTEFQSDPGRVREQRTGISIFRAMFCRTPST